MHADSSPADSSGTHANTSALPGERNHSGRWPALVVLLIFGVPGGAAAWLIVAAITDSRAGWMALLIAVVAALVLRIGKFPGGTSRAMLAALATTAGIVTSYWLVAALPIGMAMGQLPFIAASHMGLDFVWTLTRLGSTPLDWLCSGVAILLAAWLAR